ncbi:putative zinc- or iron-chelating domain-containing protein YkgJ [Pararobbsia alpina]|uniref:YkgJ family cysteine cluster protein n=1 Tax=Pararobbsia alpina TaxID=621374 RepID=UPI0039A4A08D
MSHACQSCGACCASFRVSFYWGETDAHEGGTVPSELTLPVTPHHVAMRGTDVKPVHCIALEGTVGCSVSCSIYHARSSTCREFEEGTPECAKARAIHGLPPLETATVASDSR